MFFTVTEIFYFQSKRYEFPCHVRTSTLQHGATSGCGWRRWPPYRGAAADISHRIRHSAQPFQGVFIQLGGREGFTRGL